MSPRVGRWRSGGGDDDELVWRIAVMAVLGLLCGAVLALSVDIGNLTHLMMVSCRR